MKKQIIKNNIIELQKETLKNILSSKGIIYRLLKTSSAETSIKSV